MTSSKQTTLFTETTSTSSQADSHANHSALQESGKAPMMNATCGTKCCEQFNRFSQHTLWQKMFVDYLLSMPAWSSSRCVLTWKLKATKFNRYYCLLQVSTLHTEETEFSLSDMLPTPMAQTRDLPTEEQIAKRKEMYGGKKRAMYLEHVIAQNLLPTPISGDWKGQKRKDGTANMLSGQAALGLLPKVQARDWKGPQGCAKEGCIDLPAKVNQMNQQNLLPTPTSHQQQTKFKQGGTCLQAHVTQNLLPTPTADDNPQKNTGKRNQDGLQKRAFQTTGKTSQLNPRFVAEMMGFPPDWTILPFLNGETNQ
jgi:hypothetical protein